MRSFRAWDKKAKCYVKDPILFDNFGQVYVISAETSYKRGTCQITHKPNVIREQYTGLKDKNGKEIYEGDIVRWVDDYDENAYINFEEGCFWVNWSINSERINGDMVDDLEVIGNIHENAELVEEE